MSNKSIFGKKLEGAITSDDILGKDVMDSDGRMIGVAEKVYIDRETMDFLGISVDKGFLRKGVTIGKGYIDRVTEHAIFLKVSLALEMKGMTVFDADGKKIGIVKKVLLNGAKNSIKTVEVSQGMLKKSIILFADHIATVGDNVILQVTKEELKKIRESDEKKEDESEKEKS